jgi:tyrosine-protein kinase Etk/Wzc
MDRDKQLLSVTKDNPFMQNIDAEIVSLRKDMIKNLSTTKKGIQITNEQLKNSTASFTNEINKVPPKQRIIMDLTRQQTIEETLYTYLLQRKEETEITRTSNLSIATVIDPAKSDYLPYSPNIIIVFAVAIFFGLVFPIVRIYILELMNDKVSTREDITNLCSIPILGEISHNKSNENIVALDSRSAIAEQFRALRTNLNFFINKNDEKVILLTSSMSGEGKSFVTINLASVLAVSGKKVLMMELDLRKPKISNYLGFDNSNGFSNYIISSDTDASSIIVPSNVNENLFIMSSGPIPPNPTELILDSRTDDLMVKLRKEFDYILVDAPPVGLVTDAQLMDRFCDMSIYIVRQNFTFKDQIKIADELYKNKKIKKLSIVVNDIVVKAGYGYSYGYGYGYGYGYYQQNDGKKNLFSRLISKVKK